MPNREKKARWIRFDGESSDLANLEDDDAELAQHRIELCEQEVATARENGSRREEGTALLNLGVACFSLGRLSSAIEHYEQALAISREFSDRHEEANVLCHLATAYEMQRQMNRAIEYREQAITIFREIGDRADEARQLDSLGVLFMSFGSPGQMQHAIECLQTALDICREIGDRSQEARILGNMGAVYLVSGQTERAIQCHEQALAISREISDRDKEIDVLQNLGADYLRVGQKERALECYQQALAISREIGDRDKEAMVLVSTGATYSNLGQVEKAIEITQEAVQVFEETGGTGADVARERLNRLYTQKTNRTPYVIAISIGLILLTFLVFRLFASAKAPQLQTEPAASEQIGYVGIEELYRNAPTDSTKQENWKQWENEYVGKYAKGQGKLVSMSVHPQEGKLFFIITILGEGGAIEENTTQVALLVEDAREISFGEKEGSFLVNGTRWFYVGEEYAFEGRVSNFSLFDTALASAGYGNLVIVKGKVMDSRKE
jgi:tetratricopeptide (TPR) repeat protein